MTPKNNHFDTVIVGGGVSGFYSAWRLKESYPHLRIAVFEGSNRIGGRLMSVTPPGMPSVRCELGGMRYMSNQPYISSLIEHRFRMPTQEFEVYSPQNIAHLRGIYLKLEELADAQKVPYNLSWAEKQKISDLMGFAIKQIAPDVDKYTGDDLINYLKEVKFDGKYLYEEGFWNLLYRVLSPEAFTFITESGGYDVVTQNWNALDMILVNSDFDPNVKYKSLLEGYEGVVYRLSEEFKAMGGEIFMEHRLKAFVSNEGGSELVFEYQHEKIEVTTQQLILAMPRRSLELIAMGGMLSPRNERFRKAIKSVTPVPFFKIFVCYHTPWWKNLGIEKGRSVTDLPIRQCYYWATEADQYGADKNNTNSVLLASYDDSGEVSFWTGLLDENQQLVKTSTHSFDRGIPDTWQEHLAPEALVEEINRQLAQMHNLQYIPPYYSAAYQDWSKDPYGGGVNFWNIHEKSWELIPYMINPTEGRERIFICGSAYSNKQGWVEGALETAEEMLQKYFELQKPSWVY